MVEMTSANSEKGLERPCSFISPPLGGLPPRGQARAGLLEHERPSEERGPASPAVPAEAPDIFRIPAHSSWCRYLVQMNHRS